MPSPRSKIVAACQSGKRSYPDRHTAVQAGRKAQQMRGDPFKAYRCRWVALWPSGSAPGCGQYHLATRKEGKG